MEEAQHTVNKTSEMAKEAWNKPEFESIGAQYTKQGSGAGGDTSFMSS